MFSSGNRGRSESSASVVRAPMRKGTHSCTECRKRKIRCVPLDSSQCRWCFERGRACVPQQATDPGALDKRPNVRQRLVLLENLVEILLQERDERRLEARYKTPCACPPISPLGYIRPTIPHGRPPILSLFENRLWFRLESKTSPFSFDKLSPGLSTPEPTSQVIEISNENDGIDLATDLAWPISQRSLDDTPLPAELRKAQKDQQVCQAFMNAIPSHAKLQEAIRTHSAIFAYMQGLISDENHTPLDLSLQNHVDKAIEEKKPSDVAGVAQMVATVCDLRTYEQLLLLIDRLIVQDDDYMSSLGGIEIAQFNSVLWANVGHAARGQVCSRRALESMVKLGLHKTRANKREDLIFWLSFRTDRFSSLINGAKYAIADPTENISCSADLQRGADMQEFSIKLCLLAGQIIDHCESNCNQSYESALKLDMALRQLSAVVPKDAWALKFDFISGGRPDDIATMLGKLEDFSMYYYMKILIHAPFMLQSVVCPKYDYSREVSFDAARNLIRCSNTVRRIGPRFRYRLKRFDFLAFVGCVILLLRLLSFETIDKTGSEEDWALIKETMQLFKEAESEPFELVATQSYNALLQLTQFRSPTASPSHEDIVQVMVPLFGKIAVRRGLPAQNVMTLVTQPEAAAKKKESLDSRGPQSSRPASRIMTTQSGFDVPRPPQTSAPQMGTASHMGTPMTASDRPFYESQNQLTAYNSTSISLNTDHAFGHMGTNFNVSMQPQEWNWPSGEFNGVWPIE